MQFYGDPARIVGKWRQILGRTRPQWQWPIPNQTHQLNSNCVGLRHTQGSAPLPAAAETQTNPNQINEDAVNEQ